jgi:hypothetical protein
MDHPLASKSGEAVDHGDAVDAGEFTDMISSSDQG